MGYHTDFWGSVSVDPPLSPMEVTGLLSFSREEHGPDTPGYYCQWEPTEDGTGIKWDENEKFYDSVPWMAYIIDTFLAPAGHVVNGTIDAQGEDSEDRWRLVVRDNVVSKQTPRLVWPDEDTRGYL
jgi:hypothetical protein